MKSGEVAAVSLCCGSVAEAEVEAGNFLAGGSPEAACALTHCAAGLS